MKRAGQATTEHVLLLATIMIIALIVIVIIGGNMPPSDTQNQMSRAYWRNAYPVEVSEVYQETGNDTLLIKVTNREDKAIVITNISIVNGGRRNITQFPGGLPIGAGETRLVNVATPVIGPNTRVEYDLNITYTINDIMFRFAGGMPLSVVRSPSVCFANNAMPCQSAAECCPGGGLSCQAGTCQACDDGGSLCSSSETCCSGSCVPVFGYSACCISTGRACQPGGFPPPVPCCSGTCSGNVCA